MQVDILARNKMYLSVHNCKVSQLQLYAICNNINLHTFHTVDVLTLVICHYNDIDNNYNYLVCNNRRLPHWYCHIATLKLYYKYTYQIVNIELLFDIFKWRFVGRVKDKHDPLEDDSITKHSLLAIGRHYYTLHCTLLIPVDAIQSLY